MLRRLTLPVAILASAALLAACSADDEPQETPEPATAEETSTESTAVATEEPDETSSEGGSAAVETVPFPDGWPTDLPVPDCDLLSARTYSTNLADAGGVAALTFTCTDAAAEGAAVFEALKQQTTITSDLGTSGFFETDTWQIQFGYDDVEILYNLTHK